MVFQHYGLLPHRTVLENAAFGLKLKGVDKRTRLARAEERWSRSGCKTGCIIIRRSCRVVCSSGSASPGHWPKDPAILLMDEPFSGLDPLIRREMQDEIVHLQEKLQRTVLFVTHDLDEAIRLGDRMAVMRAARPSGGADPRVGQSGRSVRGALRRRCSQSAGRGDDERARQRIVDNGGRPRAR